MICRVQPTYARAIIGFGVLCLNLGNLLADEVPPPIVSEKGPELAGAVHGVSDQKRPLLMGNGDLGVVWTGDPGKFNLGLCKNDFWGVVRGSICTAGSQSISCPGLKSASFRMEQNIGPATITGEFEGRKGEGLRMESWVAWPENIVVSRLENSGTVPLSFQTGIADGYGGGLPTLAGHANDATWLDVSPDTVPFEVGNRICKVGGPNRTTIKTMKPFVGRIAGLTLACKGIGQALSPMGAGSPLCREHRPPETPSGGFARNIGGTHG